MAKFKGFNTQQTYQLLTELGYDGPARQDQMDAFVAATPSAGSMLGRYTEIAKQRVEGKPLSGIGMNEGGQFVGGTTIGRGGKYYIKDDKGNLSQPYNTALDAYYASKGDTVNPTTGKTVTGEEVTSVDTVKDASSVTEIGETINVDGTDYTKVGADNTQELTAGESGSGVVSKMVKSDTVSAANALLGENYYDQNTGVYHYQGEEYTSPADYSEAVQNYRVSVGLEVEGESAAVLDGREITGGIDTVIDDEEKVVVDDEEEEEVVVDDEEEEEVVVDDEEEEEEEEDKEKDLLDDTFGDDLDSILDAAQKAYADAQKVLTDAQQAFNKLTDPSGLYTNSEEAYTGAFATDFNEGTDGKNKNLGEDKTWTRSTLQEYTNITKDSKVELTKPGKYYQISYPDLGISISTGHQNQQFAQGRLNILTAAVTANSNIVSAEEKEQLTLEYNTAKTNLDNAQSLIESTYADLLAAEERVKVTEIPSVAESLAKTISSPESLVTNQEVYKIEVQDGQLIDSETGQVLDAEDVIVKLATQAGAIDTPAVKSTRAYLAGLSSKERFEKYPPYPNAVPAVIPLPDSSKKAIAEYYKNQQAQIEQDAIKSRAETYEAVTSQENVKTALEDFAAATGTPSDEALMKAETMTPQELAQLDLSPETLDTIRQIPEVKRNLDTGELPTAAIFDSYTKSTTEQIEQQGDIDAAKFADDTPKATAEVDYTLNPTQSAEASITKVAEAAKFSEEASAEEKKSAFKPDVTAEETNVSATELVDVNEILNVEEIVVTGATLTALNEDSKGKAQTATFSQQLEAKFVLGEVSPQSTVEGQLEKLMASFDDGTPAWAAGALRRVNEVMNARGLGGSSMVGAAMIQAAMESAIPIAQADAATFAAMNMENVRNKQAVALSNAAAAQKFELQNLNNRQAMAVQNSMNNANLQLTNLSNTQEAVLAQAQLRAGLQNITLGISENVALANASRYAEVNNLNLTNRQQMSILESTQNLEVEMANLSNSQQTALSNLQVKASMMGQVLSNEQQMAVIESTQAFETEMQNATSKQQAFIQDAVATAAMEGRVLDNRQQTSLFNVSNQLAEREIELNNEQQTRMFNMTNKLNVEIENLSARQQTALANAQIEAAMKGQELTNKQQVNIIRSERIAEIANLNFTAEQTRAIRNSELAQTVDLANLDNRQAKLLADCAALTQVDMTNLNNRQQAAAQQAQAFLQMDMANLDNEQQATMFEAQSLVQSIFSDQAAENASLQFNAESANQAEQFFESLTTQVDQFNLAQENAMEQFNAGEENSMTKFQAELDNQRDIFNAQNQLVIAQANAVWRQSIATINNAADNEASMREAMAANNLTAAGIAELWQQERDLMEYVWRTADNAMERENKLALQNIASDGQKSSGLASAAGTFLGSIVNGMVKNKIGIFGA